VNHTVLLVDDEPDVLRSYLRTLRKQPYEIFSASCADEAIEILIAQSVDLIMPGMSGTQLLTWVANHYPDVVRILLTGEATVRTAMRAINEGQVYRFLTKPCERLELAMAIRKGLEFKDLVEKNRELLERTVRQVEDIEQARRQAENHARQLQIRTEELKLARKEAEKTNDARSDFLASMSHEIRMPMNAILEFSRLLHKEPLTKRQSENVDSVVRAGESLLTLMNDILDLSDSFTPADGSTTTRY